MRLDHIFYIAHVRCVRKLPFAGYSVVMLFEIVWDDRQDDAVRLIAALRSVGPQAAIYLANRLNAGSL